MYPLIENWWRVRVQSVATLDVTHCQGYSIYYLIHPQTNKDAAEDSNHRSAYNNCHRLWIQIWLQTKTQALWRTTIPQQGKTVILTSRGLKSLN